MFSKITFLEFFISDDFFFLDNYQENYVIRDKFKKKIFRNFVKICIVRLLKLYSWLYLTDLETLSSKLRLVITVHTVDSGHLGYYTFKIFLNLPHFHTFLNIFLPPPFCFDIPPLSSCNLWDFRLEFKYSQLLSLWTFPLPGPLPQ